MNMVNKVSRMVDHLEEVEWAMSSAASSEAEEEVKEILGPEKPNQSSLKFKLHSMTFILEPWRKSKLKGTETVRNAMVREVKTYKNVQNVRDEELSKNWSNWVQVCTHNHLKDVANAKVRARSWNKPTDAKHARDRKSKKSKRLYKCQLSKVFPTITITFSQEKVTKQ